MPPTFLIYVAVIVLALIAPIVAVISVVLVCTKQWRHLGVRLLQWSSSGGSALCMVWFALVVVFAGAHKAEWTIALATFGAGFSVGALALSAWLFRHRVLSNFRSSGRAESARRSP